MALPRLHEGVSPHVPGAVLSLASRCQGDTWEPGECFDESRQDPGRVRAGVVHGEISIHNAEGPVPVTGPDETCFCFFLSAFDDLSSFPHSEHVSPKVYITVSNKNQEI